jgi:hypothetical protein
MFVIEVFLPLDTGPGVAVDVDVVEGIVRGLADRFGGATAFTREPASGLWKRETTIERDRIIVIEVMVRDVEQEIMIRVTECRLL